MFWSLTFLTQVRHFSLPHHKHPSALTRRSFHIKSSSPYQHLQDAACTHSADGATVLRQSGIGGCTVLEADLLWTPSEEQWGLSGVSCFLGTTLSEHTLALCLHLQVHKCTYCVQRHDTLQAIAAARASDTPSTLSHRYGSSQASIQKLNPMEAWAWDKGEGGVGNELPPSTILCILPKICFVSVLAT